MGYSRACLKRKGLNTKEHMNSKHISASKTVKSDQEWMELALKLAKRAASKGDVPVGALIVKDGQLVSTGFNEREVLVTSLGHAECLAIHRANKKLGSWRLEGCTLYVTLEPCLMCAGAIVQARIPKVVYGATDPKAGAVTSLYQILQDPRLNHRAEVYGGVLGAECGKVLKDFFKERRLQKKESKRNIGEVP